MSEKILELKPCPFCGKPPSTLKNMGTIYCPNNECFGPQTTAERLEDSAVQWNARASSPAQEPVTTEPVAWTNEAQLGFLKESGYRVVPMAMWAFHHSAHPIALYAIPAPPQPGREWPEGDKVGIDPDLARALAIEECAQWHERKAELETNSLHCGDNSATIAAAHRVSVFHKACARDLRFDLTGEPK